MKKVLLFFLMIIPLVYVFAGSNLIPKDFFSNILSYSYCDQPISYRIDTVDPKFNLSRDEFLSDVNKGAEIWNSSYNKRLFIYDPKGDLSINLIYDERQSLNNQVNQLKNKVQSEKQILNPEVSEYEKLSVDFKQKLKDLNKEIEYWNNKGGAPTDEYDKLIKKQQDLQVQANSLNAMAQKLNVSTDIYNDQVNKLNQTIETFNNVLEERPEEGVFNGPKNRIEIYFNINKTELIHTIAHELGHALGIGHVNNSAAIMYYKTSQKITLLGDDIDQLQEVCKKRSYFNLFKNYLSSFQFILSQK